MTRQAVIAKVGRQNFLVSVFLPRYRRGSVLATNALNYVYEDGSTALISAKAVPLYTYVTATELIFTD